MTNQALKPLNDMFKLIDTFTHDPRTFMMGDAFQNLFNDEDIFRSFQKGRNFPKQNIVKIDDDTLVVEYALAGYSPEDISVTTENGMLIVEGGKKTEENSEDSEKDGETIYIHKGITSSHFRETKYIGDFWKVGEATYNHGKLSIELNRFIPEEQKAKSIEIKTA